MYKRQNYRNSLTNWNVILLGLYPVSYTHLDVYKRQILKTQKHISDKNILLLGVGEIGQNTVENLVKHVYQPKVKIANRSFEKAEKIAEKYKIPQIAFDDFEEELKSTDILIVAKGASQPVSYTHLDVYKRQ